MFTSTPNSRFFNPTLWRSARLALMSENGRKGVGVAKVGDAVNRLKSVRFNAKVESQKAVNVAPFSGESDATKRAKLMGLTVKALRAKAKDAGLKRYSKAPKTTLVAMLVG